MLYIRIKENSQQAKLFAEYIKTLSFVEVIEVENPDKISKEKFIEDIRKSLKEVKTKKTKPLNRLINGK